MSTTRVVYPDASQDIADLMIGERLDRISQVGTFEACIGRPVDHDDFIERIGDARAIMLGWGLPSEVMAAASGLELIAFVGIGVGNFVDLELAAARGITVCNTPGYADDTVAEHALAMMLACARHLRRLDAELRAGRWNQSLSGVQLKGRRLGLIGFGGIGARVAELARGIGMDVIVWTRSADPERARRHGVTFVELEEVLRESDVISLHVALSEETENLLDAAALAKTKPGVILINTARGEIVEEGALLDALDSGHVAAAGLDVYAREPLPADHPFVARDDVLMTPHVAFNTPEANVALLDISVDNVVAYFDGAPINVVAAPGAP